MAFDCCFGVMAIRLPKPLITPGTALQSCCQLQETGVLLADAITFLPSVMPMIGLGVIKAFSNPRDFWVGVDIPQGIEHSPVVIRCNGSGISPGFPEIPATAT